MELREVKPLLLLLEGCRPALRASYVLLNSREMFHVWKSCGHDEYLLQERRYKGPWPESTSPLHRAADYVVT